MEQERANHGVARMCRVLGVSPSGYYAWRGRRPSRRKQEDHELLERIRGIWEGSGGTYGAPRVWAELRACGVRCGRKRVARLMRAAGLVGAYRRRRRALTVRDPWAARAPAPGLVHHSDRGYQYTSLRFGARPRAAGILPSMGRRGDAYDNALCEAFFAILEREVLDRYRFQTREEARSMLFYLEAFYNLRRRHSALGYLSPAEFGRRWWTGRESLSATRSMKAGVGLMAENARVRLREVVRTFPVGRGRRFQALDGVSFSVAEGEMLVLLGPSGCGKTTILRCVAGLDVPDDGEIDIRGRCVFSRKRKVFVPPEQRNVSMVFQSYALWPHMKIWQNVAYPLENRGIEGRKARRIAEQALEMVGLAGLSERYPGQLSGGQQQRVALARALVAEADVVLLDEPLSNLDAPVREHLRVELRDLKRRMRWTALYVTHDQREAIFLADRVAVMERGKIVQIGRPEEVWRHPASPFVAQFVGCVNRVRGTVRAVEQERILIETMAGRVWGTWCAAGDPCEGGSVEAYWRAEAGRIEERLGEEVGSFLAARVAGVAAAGSSVEYLLHGDGGVGGLWRVLADEKWVLGAEVKLYIPVRELYVYPVLRSRSGLGDADEDCS